MAYIETGITLSPVQDKKLSSHSHLDVLEVANNLTGSPMFSGRNSDRPSVIFRAFELNDRPNVLLILHNDRSIAILVDNSIHVPQQLR